MSYCETCGSKYCRFRDSDALFEHLKCPVPRENIDEFEKIIDKNRVEIAITKIRALYSKLGNRAEAKKLVDYDKNFKFKKAKIAEMWIDARVSEYKKHSH